MKSISKRGVLITTLLLAFLSLIICILHQTLKKEDNYTSSGNKSCSSFAAGKLASLDGSVMTGHTLDGPFDFKLRIVPRGEHKFNEKVKIDYIGIPGGFQHIIRDSTIIPQVTETFKYFHTDCPLANEYQVFFGENTCPTKEELRTLSSEKALLDWTQVAKLALQRGKTAREAIKAAGALIEKYGLNGDGESFLVSDPNEAWCFEIPGYTNEWIAQRIPDDQVCPHANRMRIGEVNLRDTINYLSSPDLIKTAQKKGFFNPVKNGAFNFARVYNDTKNHKSLVNRRREWRMLSLLCPTQKWNPDAIEYPFAVKPEKKITVRWWIDTVWRDHYEGTAYDKTKGTGAGPFSCPDRPKISGVNCERSICVGNSAYSWVSQARSWLPNCIGGLFWFGLDCPRSTCFLPFYVGISKVPKSWQIGDYLNFSDESIWWYFQAIDSFSWLRYNEIHADVRKTFSTIEQEEFQDQLKIEKEALELYMEDPSLADDFLTKCTLDYAQRIEKVTRNLFFSLIVKYRDGLPETNVSEDWRKRLIQ
jgi:dipeptidase